MSLPIRTLQEIEERARLSLAEAHEKVGRILRSGYDAGQHRQATGAVMVRQDAWERYRAQLDEALLAERGDGIHREVG